MCGLLFLFEQDLPAEQISSRLEHGLKLLQHRGPDEAGDICKTGWGMGHRRLSIIDLQASKQPMADPDRRFWLAFNGEIYNYRELRNSLKPYWKFRTNGDTEVILAGLICKGPDFVNQMEGMWALILWDVIKKELFLSRDRVGKKPLYYYSDNGFFACASELPALSRLGTAQWEEDPDSLADYLRYGFYLPGYTAYKNVFEVLPGHNMVWSQFGVATETRYWQPHISDMFFSKQEAADHLFAQLKDAVNKRMVADVEIGAFLSGGIDSSLIVGMMSRELGFKPKTFTIGFRNKSYDERLYARQISQLYNTEHKEELLDSWDIESLKKLVFQHVGQPFADSSLLPTALVSRLASRYVKVALSGDGGDELFSGYQRYFARSLLRIYTRFPVIARRGFSHLIRSLPEPLVHHSHSLLKKAHLFLDIVERNHQEKPYIAPVLYSDDDFARLAPSLVNHGHGLNSLQEGYNGDDIMQMMFTDLLVYLPQDILVKTDRASMAHSLEVRSPFLDHKLIETAFGMSIKQHRSIFSGKRALKSTFSDILPGNIWKRHKQGFAVPVNNWFREDLLPEMQALVSGSCSEMDTTFINHLLDEHTRGIRDNGYRLWNIFVLLLWKNNRLNDSTT